MEGIIVFKVDDCTAYCNVEEATTVILDDTNFTLRKKGDLLQLIVHIPSKTYSSNSKTDITSIPTEYAPISNVLSDTYSNDALVMVDYHGLVSVLNRKSSSITNTVYVLMEWHKL